MGHEPEGNGWVDCSSAWFSGDERMICSSSGSSTGRGSKILVDSAGPDGQGKVSDGVAIAITGYVGRE